MPIVKSSPPSEVLAMVSPPAAHNSLKDLNADLSSDVRFPNCSSLRFSGGSMAVSFAIVSTALSSQEVLKDLFVKHLTWNEIPETK